MADDLNNELNKLYQIVQEANYKIDRIFLKSFEADLLSIFTKYPDIQYFWFTAYTPYENPENGFDIYTHFDIGHNIFFSEITDLEGEDMQSIINIISDFLSEIRRPVFQRNLGDHLKVIVRRNPNNTITISYEPFEGHE